jgi:arylsulfatase A-like enzyme
VIADAAAEFVKQQDATAPFLAYVSFLAPHDPRTMPRRFLELYDPAAIPLPPNVRPEHAFDNGDLRGRDELLAAFPRRPEEIRRHLAEYYAMISHLDARIGDLLATLDARGLRENTIVVLAGDNGLALGQHGLMGKQSLYEHSVRVPLVFAGPGVPAGQRTDAMAYLLDIFPTLCELTGVAAPASVEGRSLGPVLRDPAARVRDMLYLAYCGLHRGVRDARHKLVEYVVNGRRSMTQLFDLQADPWEQCNLAPDPAHAVEVARLRAELLRLRDGSGDRDTRWGQQFWSAWE